VPQLFVHVLGRLRAQHPSLEWLWESGAAWQPAVPIGFVAELMARPWTGNVRELENVAERTARLNLAPGPFRAPDPPVSGAPAPIAPTAPDALVREACEALGLARKTVVKLLPADALVALGERAGDAEARRDGLRAGAGEALLRLLEARDFNQSVVAAELGTSRTTLIKLMDDLGLPRATDLSAEDIARARAEAGGDLDAAARLLRVSAVALRKRLTILNLKSRG
jgi:two-component system nitrogen regulation response regulator GlnG